MHLMYGLSRIGDMKGVVMKRLLILMTLLIFTVGCAGGGDSEARVIALEGKMEALQTEIEGLRSELQNSNNALREAIQSNIQRVEQQLQQQLQQTIQSKFLEIQKALRQ